MNLFEYPDFLRLVKSALLTLWWIQPLSSLCVWNFTGRLHIQRSVQSSVRVKFGDDLRLDWDGRGRVLLKVQTMYKPWIKVDLCLWYLCEKLEFYPSPQLGPHWAGRTCGLCGNYNGNQGDDFLSGSGLVEASPESFGQSWRINGDCLSTHKHVIDPCAINPKRGIHIHE